MTHPPKRSTSGRSQRRYRLFVILGSHSCRSAMLMLDHKRVPYEICELTTFLHPVLARRHGFDAGGQRRTAGGRRTLVLRAADALATVPGLAAGDQRISTNRNIARYLDAHHPDHPLVPHDRRAEIEAAESWANDHLQMQTRRVVLGATIADKAFTLTTADGRMGPLMFRHPLARRMVLPALRLTFAAGARGDADRLRRLPDALDRIDGWIEDGVIGGPQLNVADCMIAPSLAMMLYRQDIRPLFTGRPCLEVVDRLLPDPAPP